MQLTIDKEQTHLKVKTYHLLHVVVVGRLQCLRQGHVVIRMLGHVRVALLMMLGAGLTAEETTDHFWLLQPLKSESVRETVKLPIRIKKCVKNSIYIASFKLKC